MRSVKTACDQILRWFKVYRGIFLISFIFFAAITSIVIRHFSPDTGTAAIDVDWRLLGELDYISGNASNELKSLDGKTVKVPGFMVPLEDNMRKVSEFLLVPSPQACIHVPPPPPNQMVYVKMEDHGAEPAYGPIWVYGTLHLKSQRHQYGEASFSLTGLRTTPYR